MKEYLKQLNEKNRSNHFMWLGRINVYNAKDLPTGIDIDSTLDIVKERLPSSFLSNVESIYIGNFDALKDRKMNAMYENGAIYIASDDILDEEEEDDFDWDDDK